MPMALLLKAVMKQDKAHLKSDSMMALNKMYGFKIILRGRWMSYLMITDLTLGMKPKHGQQKMDSRGELYSNFQYGLPDL